jgi:hypothetical protein
MPIVKALLVCAVPVAFLSIASTARANNCPKSPTPTITSALPPSDVCVPDSFPKDQNPIRFFDDYSWRIFIAMVWPAALGQRGHPDVGSSMSGPGPRVFETLKPVWEIFHSDGSAPAAWNVYDAPIFNACKATVSFGGVVLASFSKFSDLGEAGLGNLVGPLVAQNVTYVRYLTGINEIEFDQIQKDQLYLRKNIPQSPNHLTFQDGALDVKSSWILMSGVPHPERYYTRTALVLDARSGNCAPTTVGLVGLHIVQKTSTRPQWIWSTFEQVDNVPPADSGGAGSFNFNDGSAVDMPPKNPLKLNPLMLPPPKAFNVQRLVPINASTAGTNRAYRGLLHGAGNVWQFYQLVMTQWPIHPSRPSEPGIPANTFPNDSSTAFANVTMETFDQTDIRTGCMNCHNFTRVSTDFLWSLNDHAFPSRVPGVMLRNRALQSLRVLLENPSSQ